MSENNHLKVTTVIEETMIHNLNMHNSQEMHLNPILTLSYGKQYRYRFVSLVRAQRHDLLDTTTYNEAYDIPYQFILAILKYFVHNVDAVRDKEDHGNYPQTLLLAESKKRDYAIAIIVTIKDFLVTVVSTERILSSEFISKKIHGYPMERKLFFSDLDLDAYLEEIEKKKKTRFKEISKKYPVLWESEDSDMIYYLSCTAHLQEKRSNKSGKRLTIPIDAVKDVLRYAIKNAKEDLKAYIGTSEKEKQLVVIFPSYDKSYNIGILIAVNEILVTVISMYDVSPQDKGYNTLIFPNAKRLVMSNYDLKTFMDEYNRQKADERAKRLEIAKKDSGKITIISSYDAYLPKLKTQIATPTEYTSKRLRKITKIPKEKSIEGGSNKLPHTREVKTKENLRIAAINTLSANLSAFCKLKKKNKKRSKK